MCVCVCVREYQQLAILYRSFGFQLTKTVRSRLSLMLSHGMSSSSGHRDMDFKLSSKVDDLNTKCTKHRLSVYINTHMGIHTDRKRRYLLRCIILKEWVNFLLLDTSLHQRANQDGVSSGAYLKSWSLLQELLTIFT